jgi:hypothetical protein
MDLGTTRILIRIEEAMIRQRIIPDDVTAGITLDVWERLTPDQKGYVAVNCDPVLLTSDVRELRERE